MKRKLFKSRAAVFLFALLISACSSGNYSETPDNAPQNAVPTAELVAQADALYAQREDLAKVREAVTLLKRARYADPKNFEAAWKLAQADYFLGKNTTDAKESDAAFKEGIAAGEDASNLAPDKPDGYFWAGANLGGKAQKHPFTDGIASVNKIREKMNKIIEINPAYQGASAYDVLAQVELATRLTGGKNEKALEYLEKAVAIEKDNSFVRLHLAETFLALNRKDDAKKQLDYLLKIKPSPDYLPEYKESADAAQKLLDTKF